MFVKAFLGVVIFAISASAQQRTRAVETDATPSVVVAVSPDAYTIAIGRGSSGAAKRYGRVELWNTQTGELQRTISGFDGPVWALAFTRDGQSLMTVSTEYRDAKIQASVKNRDDEKVFGELKWWNTHTGEFLRKVSVAGEGIESLEATWSANVDVLALIERRSGPQLTQVSEFGAFGQRRILPGFVSFEETELKLLDAQTGERRVKLEGASRNYRTSFGRSPARSERPVFSADGSKLAALTGEEVSLWDVATGNKILTLKKLNGWPTALAFSGDSHTLAVASAKGRMPGGESEISLWDVATGRLLNRLKGRNDQIACLQFVAQDRALLIGSLEYENESAVGTVKMWDLRENRLAKSDVHAEQAVSSLTLIPERDAVVLQSGSDVELRDAKTFAVRYSFAPTTKDDSDSMRRSRFLLTAKRALDVQFSADGTTVSAAIPGEGIRAWDARTGGLKDQSGRQEMPQTTFTAVADGQMIKVQEAKTVIKTIDAGEQVTAVAIDRSGELVAAARADFSIGVWNVKTGMLQVELRKHEDTVNALAFSNDGRTLASGGDDRTAIMWDVSSGRSKRTLKGHDVTVTSLAFSPDGQTLATGTGNAAVVLWNLSTGKLDRVLH